VTHQVGETLLSQLDVGLRCLARPLLERGHGQLYTYLYEPIRLPNTAMDADAGGLLAHPARRGSSRTFDGRGVAYVKEGGWSGLDPE
jgi:hypothetical protein